MPLRRKSPVGSDRIEPAIFPREIPTGGERGQTLKKRSAHDFDFEWIEEHIGDVSGLEAFISEITGIVEGLSNTIDGLSNDISNINLALNNKVDKNDPITASPDSERLVGYDAKGLVTGSGGKGVIANSAITASPTIYRIVRYDAKGLVTAGVTPGIGHITGLQSALDERQIIRFAYSEWYLRDRHLDLRGESFTKLADGFIEEFKGVFVSGDGSGTWQGITLPSPQVGNRFLTFHIVYSYVQNNEDLLHIRASFMGGFAEILQQDSAHNGDNVFLLYDGVIKQWTVISWWSSAAFFNGFVME
ncbi:MAG: hypothetical protein RBR62_04965 [Bacteroidales bacterium]|jgi:hypothetical protein|nr:hypothetical protein [Bacteroidales bacterium]